MKLAKKRDPLYVLNFPHAQKPKKPEHESSGSDSIQLSKNTRIFKDGYFKVQDVHNDLAKNPRGTVCFVL